MANGILSNHGRLVVKIMNIDRKQEIENEVHRLVTETVGDKPVISVRELWRSCVGTDRPINWIKSYKTLLKYVTLDYKDIFEPTSKGKESGTRYYIKSDKIVDFIYRFETGKLD